MSTSCVGFPSPPHVSHSRSLRHAPRLVKPVTRFASSFQYRRPALTICPPRIFVRLKKDHTACHLPRRAQATLSFDSGNSRMPTHYLNRPSPASYHSAPAGTHHGALRQYQPYTAARHRPSTPSNAHNQGAYQLHQQHSAPYAPPRHD